MEKSGGQQKGPGRTLRLGGLDGAQEDAEPFGKKNSPGQAGTLRNILAGGTWPQTRVAEVVPETPLTCPNRGDPQEDEYHR
eukprot:9410731-Heterocapsa_arctica.AAC.1